MAAVNSPYPAAETPPSVRPDGGRHVASRREGEGGG